jgi:succinate-semialdehyde dehydrogenase/glutarate-semialdehyde dehydrogenase
MVQQGKYDEFKTALIRELKSLKTGDPRDSQTNLGPLARTDLTDHLGDQVKRAIQVGARDVIPWKRDHNLVSPCLLEYEASNTVLQNEELFGPVISMLKFKEPEDAFTYSNASPFGLGVSLYTGDVQRMLPHLSLLQEGAVAINRPVQSDPKYPFGGVKKSGYGREMGKEGLLSFTNRKFITVAN